MIFFTKETFYSKSIKRGSQEKTKINEEDEEQKKEKNKKRKKN